MEGPDMAPQPPDARSTPAKPWRSSKFALDNAGTPTDK